MLHLQGNFKVLRSQFFWQTIYAGRVIIMKYDTIIFGSNIYGSIWQVEDVFSPKRHIFIFNRV